MIFGECPNCDEPVSNAIASGPLPQYQHAKCPTCGKFYWLKHSRIDPEAYTEETFATMFKVDDETKALTPIDARA